jgi:hypothetical protein
MVDKILQIILKEAELYLLKLGRAIFMGKTGVFLKDLLEIVHLIPNILLRSARWLSLMPIWGYVEGIVY